MMIRRRSITRLQCYNKILYEQKGGKNDDDNEGGDDRQLNDDDDRLDDGIFNCLVDRSKSYDTPPQ